MLLETLNHHQVIPNYFHNEASSTAASLLQPFSIKLFSILSLVFYIIIVVIYVSSPIRFRVYFRRNMYFSVCTSVITFEFLIINEQKRRINV